MPLSAGEQYNGPHISRRALRKLLPEGEEEEEEEKKEVEEVEEEVRSFYKFRSDQVSRLIRFQKDTGNISATRVPKSL